MLKPFDEGMKVEGAGFAELLEGTASKALRHVFFATRAAAKVPDVPLEHARRARSSRWP